MSDANVLEDDDTIREYLVEPSRVAVLGMKPEGAAGSIPRYLARHGFEIVPVNPKYDELGGRECIDRVDQINGAVRIVDVFRRSETLRAHADEIVSMDPRPELVWFQLGIRNDDAAERLVSSGISVIQDRCIKVEHGRLVGDF